MLSLSFRLAAVLLAVAAVADRAVAAGAAYQVDTAEVSEPGNCKVESWTSFAQNGDFIASSSPDCVVSLFGKAVDMSAQFSRFKSDDEWGTAVFPKAKTNLIPTAIGQWGVAVSGSACSTRLMTPPGPTGNPRRSSVPKWRMSSLPGAAVFLISSG